MGRNKHQKMQASLADAIRSMHERPLYVVKLNHETVGVDPPEYYSLEKAWGGVPKEQAQKMSHKEARSVSDYLRSIKQGYHCEVEPA